MSGLVTGIAKVFGSTLGAAATGAAKLGAAVRGVGASLFTAGAATGASAVGRGGLFGNGILSSMMNGVGNLFGGGQGSIIAAGQAVPATAVDPITTGSVAQAATDTGRFGGGTTGTFGKGFGVSLDRAATPTGVVPAGASASTTPGAPKGFMSNLREFLGTEGGAGLMAGVGAGLGSYMEAKAYEDTAAANRKAVEDQEKRITKSYDVPLEVLSPTSKMWKYNPASGQIELG